ncbi:DUF3806 domain-containing protein [Roseateles sp. DXS20W]|uniref:DUF3806 domain-containing protein n=1 Tax=Pelomonas lactea TaxID=3299030 RepID=A0ABW7GNA5_9BURK
MSQEFLPLSETDLQNLEAKRRWVREHYERDAEAKYQKLSGKLTLLSAILSNGWIQPDETLKLQCLGISFGDALAQLMGLEWRMVVDEYGRDPALIQPGTSIVLFPQTMISKRIEKGERVDVHELFKSTCNTIQALQSEGA